jgi:hypothetical protein
MNKSKPNYNTVENPIPNSKLYVTPSLQQVQEFINALPLREQANANIVLMFTLNACHQLVEDEILSKEIFL